MSLKRLPLVFTTALLALPSSHAAVVSTDSGPVLVNDFNSLAGFTQTVILNNTDSTANITFSTAGGFVSVSSTSVQPEQVLLLNDDISLGVGQTITLATSLAASASGVVDDFGLAIASTESPTGVAAGSNGDTRVNNGYSFLFVAARSNTDEIRSAGSNGTTVFGTDVDGGLPESTILGLFITRTSSTTYDLGYLNGAGVPVTTISRTVADTNLGTAIGLYADLRGASLTTGAWDRLTLTPEPSSVLLGAIGLLGVLRRRRA